MALHRVALFWLGLAVLLATTQACMSPPTPRATGTAGGVQRLYILNCGEGVAGDISRWTPGINVGKSMPFVDSCYLIRHSRGWLLWDTGLSDSVAAMPDGLRPADPRATHWRLPRTLASQLQEIGVTPDEIKYVAVSHSHPDHAGNVKMFPRSMLLVQKSEYEWPQPSGPRFPPDLPVTKVQGDHDVFGDGSAVLIATPGHTPGHQSLLIRLPRTGVVVLSGDAAHFRENWDARRVPDINANKEQSAVSMQRLADLITLEKAQFWINHDKVQRDSQKLSPAFYD